MRKIILAFDSFKGSVQSLDIAGSALRAIGNTRWWTRNHGSDLCQSECAAGRL